MSDLVVHLAPAKTYVINCPECHRITDGSAQNLPADFCNPFVFECSCGHSEKVLLNFRKTHRKPCRLSGEYCFVLDNMEVKGVCTILDLSKRGIRFEAKYLDKLQAGLSLRVIITLDDMSHTRLLVPGVIRWFKVFKKRAVVAVEFDQLSAHQQSVLGFYLL
jgi:hypothetical protein